MEGGCHFNWQWNIGKPLWNSFTKQGTRALIVSPFVRANFLSRVVSGFNRIDLVSTQNELDALSDEFYKTLAAKAKVFVVRPAETENGSAAMQLHAKLFICETETECKVLLGSANASDSAWKSRNCEAVVSFVPGMSIDQFYQSFIISPKTTGSEKNALRGWVERYERRPVTVDETALAEKALDKLQKMLIGLNFHASYDLEKMLLRITCPEMSSQLELVETVAHHRLRLCPLSRYERAGDLVSADNLLTGGVEFSGIRVLDLSDFLVVEIEHPSKVARQFIVMASTDYAGLRDARDAAILNEYLTAESFRLFMRAILFDGVNQSPPKGSGATRQKKGEETGWTLLGEITLEEVLQSCTEDPSRIGEINQLLQVFRETKAADGEFILFQEFWNVFQTAHAETERDLHG